LCYYRRYQKGDAVDLVGRNLGKYHILKELGQGGMGIVYKAFDPTLEREVAVKVLAAHLTGEDEFVQRFLREARAAAKLDHPNIVTIHEVGQEENLYYFVMTLLAGQSLAQILEGQGPLSFETVLSVTEQVAGALDYAHERGFVHRDVKPSNIVVDAQGRAVLTDFGLVRAEAGVRLTRTGVMLGTPEYMSPEQALEEEATAASDLYALAVVVYEMLVGQAPFQAQTPLGVLMKQLKEAPPRLRPRNPAISEELEEVVLAALSKDPRARPASGAIFVESLRQAMAASRREVPSSRVPPIAQPFPVPPDEPEEVAVLPMVPEGEIVAEPVPMTPRPVSPPAQPALETTRPSEQPEDRRRIPPWMWFVFGFGMIALAFAVGMFINMGTRGNHEPTVMEVSPTSTPDLGETDQPVLSPSPVIIVATGEPTEAPTETLPPRSTVTPSPLPTDTVPPTDTPVPTSTPAPTDTAPPPTETPRPTSTSPPTVTPTPCPEVTGPFAQIWLAEQERLGCALNEAHASWIAQEVFERGQMLWRQDTDGISVLYADGTFAVYDNPWQEGDPVFSCTDIAPEESPPTPIRGFGKIWCTYTEVREGLGWATEAERGFYGTVQDFEGGSILRTDGGDTYLLLASGIWSIP
jgi:serine/threonine-protein kinase